LLHFAIFSLFLASFRAHDNAAAQTCAGCR
jgi:hypothetical protein